MASKPSKAEQRAMAKQESEDQSARVSCAAGAAALGAGLCFILPVVGGLTLACVGAVGAVGLTTRNDSSGDAARASGAAVAVGAAAVAKKVHVEKLVTQTSAALARARDSTRDAIATTRQGLAAKLERRRLEQEQAEVAAEEAAETRAALESVAAAPRDGRGAFFATRSVTVSEPERAPRTRLEVYGEALRASEAAVLMLREVADAPPDARRKVALQIVRDVHPDRAADLAGRAAATALTRVALAVRDYGDECGWGVLDTRSFESVANELRARVKRNDF